MTDDEHDPPRDPFVDHEHATGMLDRARERRLALLDLPDLSAVFVAVSALSDEECTLTRSSSRWTRGSSATSAADES